MHTTAQSILAYTEKLSEGAVICAKELLHLGTRATVDQSLSRLTKRGSLLRVGRGLYTRPVKTRFGQRPPAPETVVEALAEHTGETVTTSGAAAANKLGLTTQTPVKLVYLTSGPSRKIRLGKQEIQLRHARAWELKAPNSPAGNALRALSWLGPQNSHDKLSLLSSLLNKQEQFELAKLRATAPSWLAKELGAFAVHG